MAGAAKKRFVCGCPVHGKQGKFGLWNYVAKEVIVGQPKGRAVSGCPLCRKEARRVAEGEKQGE